MVGWSGGGVVGICGPAVEGIANFLIVIHTKSFAIALLLDCLHMCAHHPIHSSTYTYILFYIQKKKKKRRGKIRKLWPEFQSLLPSGGIIMRHIITLLAVGKKTLWIIAPGQLT